ncbi:hypothetical protein [Salinicoccus albus]|uniref:hypothetical protein n=1 Tax=Salinicoccus albus TaxID=418756 RepID=UPI0003AABE70|nr:hypothetical protein [Salinicoccus albus]
MKEESAAFSGLFLDHLKSAGDYYLSLVDEEGLKQKLNNSSLNFEVEDFILYV